MPSDRFKVFTGVLTPRMLQDELNKVDRKGLKVISVSIGEASNCDIREANHLPVVIVTENPYG